MLSPVRSRYYIQMIKNHLSTLDDLKYESGLFAASSKKVATGYDKSWLRDNFYECLAYETVGDWATVQHTYDAIMKIFLKHEKKIDHAIKVKPNHGYEYIHARFNPLTFDEFWEEWGNKQNDSIGAILFKIGEIEHHQKFSLLKNPDYLRITQKLINYLEAIQYWKDSDNGMWENDEEVHSSSIGACVAGLQSLKRHAHLHVPHYLVSRGQNTLHKLLPRESQKRFVDLSLLSLLYPYDVVTIPERTQILDNIEYHLVKQRGVVRYRNDWYYNRNPDSYSEEAEWCFGFSWLAIIYEHLGNRPKARFYLKKAISVTDEEGNVPELYYSNSPIHNENTPLGWGESLFVTAIYNLLKAELPKELPKLLLDMHVGLNWEHTNAK